MSYKFVGFSEVICDIQSKFDVASLASRLERLEIDPLTNSKPTGLANVGERYIPVGSKSVLLFDVDENTQTIFFKSGINKSLLYKAMGQRIDLMLWIAERQKATN